MAAASSSDGQALWIGLARVNWDRLLKELFRGGPLIPAVVADEVITGGFPARRSAQSPQQLEAWLALQIAVPSQRGPDLPDLDEGEAAKHSPGPCKHPARRCADRPRRSGRPWPQGLGCQLQVQPAVIAQMARARPFDPRQLGPCCPTA